MEIEVKRNNKLNKNGLLTEREITLIKYIAAGWTDPEISKKLGISTSYIRSDLINKILEKAAVTNRPSLVYWATKNGVI